MGKQYQAYTKEHVYPVSLAHVFAASVQPIVAAAGGTFPVVGTKIPLSAAQSQKVMSPMGLGLTAGDISLDDANDRILLEPGVYAVEISLEFVENGTDSDYGVALTTAAAAANDVEFESIRGSVIPSTVGAHFHTIRYITVTALRALELHVAWHTAGATGVFTKGSFLRVTRIGNVE